MKLFGIATVALLASSLALAAPAKADDFAFDAVLEGDGTLEWEVDFTETEDWTTNAGAEFGFSGGAGTEGEANAYGDVTGVGGYFMEEAGGSGDAYSHTNGNNWATASFGSESLSVNGGFAADLEFGGDPSKIKYDGNALGGGGGSAETGLTLGTNYAYNQTGTVTYDVDADLHFDYVDAP